MKYEYYVVQSQSGGFLRADPVHEVRKKVQYGRLVIGSIASFAHDGGAGKLRAEALADSLNGAESTEYFITRLAAEFNKLPWPAAAPSRTVNTTEGAGCGTASPTLKAWEYPAAKRGWYTDWSSPELEFASHFIIGSNKGFAPSPAKHALLETAQREAERLAKKHLGEEFTVYKAVETKTGQEGESSLDVKIQAHYPEVEYHAKGRWGKVLGKRTGVWADTSWSSLKEAEVRFPLTKYREVKIEQPGEPVVTTKKYSTY